MRKKTQDGPFSIFTDYDSIIQNYKRIATLIGRGAFLNACVVIVSVILDIVYKNFTVLPFNLIFNGSIAVGLGVLFFKCTRKIKKMKNERQLHE